VIFETYTRIGSLVLTCQCVRIIKVAFYYTTQSIIIIHTLRGFDCKVQGLEPKIFFPILILILHTGIYLISFDFDFNCIYFFKYFSCSFRYILIFIELINVSDIYIYYIITVIYNTQLIIIIG